MPNNQRRASRGGPNRRAPLLAIYTSFDLKANLSPQSRWFKRDRRGTLWFVKKWPRESLHEPQRRKILINQFHERCCHSSISWEGIAQSTLQIWLGKMPMKIQHLFQSRRLLPGTSARGREDSNLLSVVFYSSSKTHPLGINNQKERTKNLS